MKNPPIDKSQGQTAIPRGPAPPKDAPSLEAQPPPIPASMDCPFEKIFPSALRRDAHYFMAHAYNQAIEAWKADEVPIGAVIERGGMIIASAHNRSRASNDPTAHAEILAISQAAHAIGDWRLNACTLYVTKEPCPMCSGALVVSRIGKVVYGLPDPKMGCLGGAVNLGALPESNHQFAAAGGVMEAANHELLRAFFEAKRRANKPPNTSGKDFPDAPPESLPETLHRPQNP